METIRQGCFETNSSSTHSITLCTKSDYDKWKDGELYYFREKFVTPEQRDEIIRKRVIENKININWEGTTMTLGNKTMSFSYKDDSYSKIRDSLITPELLAEITQEEIDTFLKKCDLDDVPITYKEYEEDFLEGYDWYAENFTTPSGDEIIAFGYYGNDY